MATITTEVVMGPISNLGNPLRDADVDRCPDGNDHDSGGNWIHDFLSSAFSVDLTS